jgi:hypothetical protein
MPRRFPTRDQLIAYRDRGLSVEQIADAWAEEVGERVDPAFIRFTFARYEVPRP